MRKKIVAIFAILLCGVFTSKHNLWAEDLEDALESAVEYISETGRIRRGQKIMIGSVVNLHSQKKDHLSKKIETALYFEMEKRFPDIKLYDEAESLSGVSLSNTVIVKGSYEKKGADVFLVLKAVKNTLSGELLATAKVEFEIDSVAKKALVAVLDLEAPHLNKQQIRAFSDIFRSALSKHGNFEIASSAEIERFDPKAIQNTYQCSRDECATIIGQQMGLDNVISSTFSKISADYYVLSAKLLAIEGSAILKTETIKHSGSLQTLDNALEQLAQRLTGSSASTGSEFATPSGGGTVNVKGGIIKVTPSFSGNRKSSIAGLIFTTNPAGAEVFFGNMKVGTTPFQNLRLKAGKSLKITLKKDNYHIGKLDYTLSGGINELGTIDLSPNFGSLKIESEPSGAEVWLAGNMIGKTPYYNKQLTSGNYLLSLNYPLYLPLENKKIVIRDGQETDQVFKLSPNFGVLKIQTKPKGTTVVIKNKDGDEIKRGKSPVEFKLNQGQYTTYLSKTGYEPLEFKTSIVREKTFEIAEDNATLRRYEADLMISSEPFIKGADVLVDGKVVASVPANISVPAGTREIQIRTDDYIGLKTVTVQDGKADSISIKLGNRLSASEYQSRHDFWRVKWLTTLSAAILSAGYAFGEYQSAQASNEKMKSAETEMLASSSAENARLKQAEVEEHAAAINQHNSSALLGSGVSIGFWIWFLATHFNEPAIPSNISFYPGIDIKNGASLKYSYKW
jgi:hypothetical protein